MSMAASSKPTASGKWGSSRTYIPKGVCCALSMCSLPPGAGKIPAALVPPDVSGTVPGISRLVVHPNRPKSGMGHWPLYFLTSAHGQAELAKRITVNATSFSLSATSLSEVEIPVPAPRRLALMAQLVETSEEAYSSEMRAPQLRRQVLRDAIVQDTFQAAETT